MDDVLKNKIQQLNATYSTTVWRTEFGAKPHIVISPESIGTLCRFKDTSQWWYWEVIGYQRRGPERFMIEVHNGWGKEQIAFKDNKPLASNRATIQRCSLQDLQHAIQDWVTLLHAANHPVFSMDECTLFFILGTPMDTSAQDRVNVKGKASSTKHAR